MLKEQKGKNKRNQEGDIREGGRRKELWLCPNGSCVLCIEFLGNKLLKIT